MVYTTLGMELAEIHKSFANETRLRILHLLLQGPLCVCHFQTVLKADQVAISKHLAYLRTRNIVTATPHEQWMIYNLPNRAPDSLSIQLRCLKETASTIPLFREDLKRLKKVQAECDWINGAVEKARIRKAHAKTCC